MSDKPLKFLIIPNYAVPYDQRMVSGLAKGLNIIGHDAFPLSSPITSIELLNRCISDSIDIVIQVNRTRDPEVELPEHVRFVSWYQDVFPETVKGFSDRFHDKDILYALGDPVVLGFNFNMPCFVGTLLTGVDSNIFKYKKINKQKEIDFSLCGFIPEPPRTMGLFEKMKQTVENEYIPLNGSLDIHALEVAIRRDLAPYPNAYSIIKQGLLKFLYRIKHLIKDDGTKRHMLSPFERSISFYTREYPRLLDRVELIDAILSYTKSIELYGVGWDKHKKYKPYSKGVISNLDALLAIYKKSKINLANNTHGLGLHSRTLECMAVGGFILTHDSPHDNKPGGLHTSFIPNKHYGVFNRDNIVDEADAWMKDKNKRQKAGELSSEIVMQQHCWQHRAQQIIKDLQQ